MKPQYDLDRESGLTRSTIAVNALVEALAEQTANEHIDMREPYEPGPPKFWPSTIGYIQSVVGGLYGVTAVAAEKGAGKSLLATGSAIEAAATGEWQVAHFVAEDDYDGLRERFNMNLAAHRHLEDCYDHYHPIAVGKGQTPESICAEVMSVVNTGIDVPVLIVMDSINSIVNLNEKANYLGMLRSFGLWAMFSRRISRADASFLLVTESNKRGESKGETLPFWSDVYLQMKKKSDHVVEMTLGKTRRTAGEGPMGKHMRTWTQQRFYRASEQPELRVVNGGLVSTDDEEMFF